MSRRVPAARWATASGICLAVVLGLAADTAVATGHEASPTAGAAGIGDPYYPLDGNGGYDVERYVLDLRYDPDTEELAGTATIEAVATQLLSRFDLDLQGLDVESVTVAGREASWSRDGGELVVTPHRPLWNDRAFTTVVTYSGVPEPVDDELGLSGFIATDDGAIAAGQPDGADTWFPANDHPLDPAAFEVRVTVPAGLQAVSNGILVDERTDGDLSTWHWRAEEPMATYLTVLAIGEFDVRAREVDGVRYWDALDPDLFDPPADGDRSPGEVAEGSLDRQPEMVEVLTEWLGRPYPLTAGGGIVDDAEQLSFALETQTRPIYSADYFTRPTAGDLLVVHELAHQWLGNAVRLAGWRHIWLNEGFATYAEWVWQEHEGLATADEQFDELAALPADDDVWAVTPGDPGPDTEALFSDAVYLRGAMTLHALRREVGEDAFGRIVRDWASRAGSAVTTDQFIDLAEEESGQDLDALFETWLHTEGKPDGIG